jgi:hypothetical protein
MRRREARRDRGRSPASSGRPTTPTPAPDPRPRGPPRRILPLPGPGEGKEPGIRDRRPGPGARRRPPERSRGSSRASSAPRVARSQGRDLPEAGAGPTGSHPRSPGAGRPRRRGPRCSRPSHRESSPGSSVPRSRDGRTGRRGPEERRAAVRDGTPRRRRPPGARSRSRASSPASSGRPRRQARGARAALRPGDRLRAAARPPVGPRPAGPETTWVASRGRAPRQACPRCRRAAPTAPRPTSRPGPPVPATSPAWSRVNGALRRREPPPPTRCRLRRGRRRGRSPRRGGG